MSYKPSDGGKGSKPRPITDKKQFEDNWDKIFNNKEKNNAADGNSKTNVQKPKDR